jgi:hypothetical protein
MQLKTAKPYHAKLAGRSVIRMPDGKSVFKIYYLSMLGRDNPSRYEWEANPFTRENFEDSFSSGDFEGIGFITAFPHITKVFRFSPYTETVLDVREIDTRLGKDLDVSRPDGSHEFACYAEIIIAALEMAAWAQAPDVQSYLSFRMNVTEFDIQNNSKLADYWQGDLNGS